jgi:hypothetical protein
MLYHTCICIYIAQSNQTTNLPATFPTRDVTSRMLLHAFSNIITRQRLPITQKLLCMVSYWHGKLAPKQNHRRKLRLRTLDEKLGNKKLIRHAKSRASQNKSANLSIPAFIDPLAAANTTRNSVHHSNNNSCYPQQYGNSRSPQSSASHKPDHDR